MIDHNDPRSEILEPRTLRFLQELDAAGGAPIHSLTPDRANERLLQLQAQGNGAAYPMAFEQRTISAGQFGMVSLLIARPIDSSGLLPGVIYLHGGVGMLGDGQTHDRLVRELANGAAAAVVFVNYSRSPEAKYPVALEQAYSVAEWLAVHGTEIGVDCYRLAVAGDGEGAALAVGVALLATRRSGPQFAFQLLLNPLMDANFETASYRRFGAGDYWLSRAAMEQFWNSYVDPNKRHESLVAPLRATLDELRAFPPALVVTAECDPLRDEGEAFARRLMQAGVTVTATCYLGTIHDFLLLNALAATPATRGAIAQANTLLRQAFAR